MTFIAASALLENHSISWWACSDPDKIEALDESVTHGVLALEWVQLPLVRIMLATLPWAGHAH